MKKRIIVGLSGASGVIYGIRTLEHLRSIDDVEVHLVMSEGARVNIKIETDETSRPSKHSPMSCIVPTIWPPRSPPAPSRPTA